VSQIVSIPSLELCLQDIDRFTLEGPHKSQYAKFQLESHTLSVTMQLRVGPEKLQAAITSLESWCTWDSASRRELDSLLGSLTFISRAVRLSRSVLRRMIECRYTATKRPRVPLSDGFRDDARWWLRFASEWNGVELVGPRRAVRADLQLELFTGRVRQHDRRPLRQRFQVPLPDIGGQVSLNSHPERAFAGFKTLRAILVTFNALRISLPRFTPTLLVTPRQGIHEAPCWKRHVRR